MSEREQRFKRSLELERSLRRWSAQNIELNSSVSALEIAHQGAERNYQLLEFIFGSVHPLVKELKANYLARISQYFQITRELLQECKKRWDWVEGVSDIDEKEALKHIAFFDHSRIYFFASLKSAIYILNQGVYEKRVCVPYEVIRPQGYSGKEDIELKAQFASEFLVYKPKYGGWIKGKPYQVIIDSRVPFKYLLTCEENYYDGWFDQITEILAQLYNGEPLPLNKDAQVRWPKGLYLFEETRQELGNFGLIMLVPNLNALTIQSVADPEEKSVLVVSADVEYQPWIKDGWPTVRFFKILGLIGHEVEHEKDQRKYAFAKAGSFSPSVLELNACCFETAFQRDFGIGYTDASIVLGTREYLVPYLALMQGSQKVLSFNENQYLGAICSQISLLDLKNQDILAGGLEEVGIV